MIQPGLSVLFNGLSIHECSFRRFLLPHRVQQPVVDRGYLIDNLPVGIVEGKIRREEFCLCLIDCATASTKINNQIIEIECGLKDADGLAMKAASIERAVTQGICKRNRRN